MRLCVLYVEDEPDDVFFMRKAMDRMGIPIDLRTVEQGDLAVAYLSGQAPFDSRDQFPRPDLLIIDLNLPVRSGFDVLRWIRSSGEWNTLPVVVFSSSGRVEDRAQAAECGASLYLLKPASGLQFDTVVRELVRLIPSTPGAG